jgi:hypothetical protein
LLERLENPLKTTATATQENQEIGRATPAAIRTQLLPGKIRFLLSKLT